MPGKSTLASNKVLGKILRNEDFMVAGTYVALFKTLPNDDGVGGVEVSGGEYVRKAASFTVPANGQAVNTLDLIYPVASASWGLVVGWGLFDALTGGNMWYSDTLEGGVQKQIDSGDQLMVPAGSCVIVEQ